MPRARLSRIAHAGRPGGRQLSDFEQRLRSDRLYGRRVCGGHLHSPACTSGDLFRSKRGWHTLLPDDVAQDRQRRLPRASFRSRVGPAALGETRSQRQRRRQDHRLGGRSNSRNEDVRALSERLELLGRLPPDSTRALRQLGSLRESGGPCTLPRDHQVERSEYAPSTQKWGLGVSKVLIPSPIQPASKGR